ncbi:hypothetical protein KORDIASMS9_02670 [Kordia sp. SMS9]|uniref:hypothetical protein n=1 Tax=Kordia sp. SMS9 TaxID=2282170 RepID=UPI000E0D8E3D|nr:hypothetical protein [Kordia sp. SMS9]AXG70430.1 hypothetical protein KORDIASMS9_02670 [Kordia sp. SMS9]
MHELLRQLIGKEIQENEKVVITTGTVKVVRENDCDVDREFKPELLGVRFHSIKDDLENFVKITPKVESVVLCAIIENDISEAVIISYSEIEKIHISTDGAEFEMFQGKFKIKNENADLKSILETSHNVFKNVKILTPSGIGTVSPSDKTLIEQNINKINQIFT